MTRTEVTLPVPTELERTCKGLAALDALVAHMGSERTLASLKPELDEIGYAVSSRRRRRRSRRP